MIASALLLLATQFAGPDAAATVRSYTGTARAGDGGAVLYRERHYLFRGDGRTQRLVLYSCPDGRPFARKRVGDGPAPDFDFVDGRSGYREGVRSDAGERRVYVREVGSGRTRSRALPDTPQAVIDSGFDAFLQAHWGALLAGRSVSFEFLVPSRLRYIRFRVSRHDDTRAARAGQVVFRLRLASWFGFALPHIDVGYDRASQRLAWYRGLSNVRDLHGDNLTVVLDYPAAAQRDDVDAQAVRQALQAPLDGRCRLH